MCASAILRLARTSRCAIVGSLTRNARAISPVVRPPSVRSVSATRAGIASAGWQHVKISRSRSSSTALSSARAVFLGLDASELGEPLGPVGERAVAAQAVDRPAARGDGDPRAGVGGDAVARPGRDRAGERVLNGVLGELEVADVADQRRQHGRALLAERPLDGGGRVLPDSGRRSPRTAHAVAVPPPDRPDGIALKSTIGRTSTEP